MNNICPICGSRNIDIFLRRQNVPVHQNLPLNTPSEAIHCTKGTLELSVCQDCNFIFNSQFDEHKMEYNENYNNNQLFSPSFRQYVDDIINYLIIKQKIENSTILEIGCGKGDFIRELISKGYGNKGIGFDPSYIGSEEMYDGKLRYIKDFFDSRYNNIPADIVICRHVIEHISNPLHFLINLKKSLQNTSDVRVFFETPCAEWILKNNAFWDFFYEHCSYFTTKSLTHVFELAGFKVEDVKHIFNGQYLWLEATLNKFESKKALNSNLVDFVNQYKENETNIINKWNEKLKILKDVAVWGAGAKGVTFVNLLDPERKLINCVVDINPDKQGKFIPGTGHPIINYPQVFKRKITSVIVMNPNYMDEIRKLISNSKIRIELLGVE
jgi:SAM-dependent methyltransferase